MTDSNLLQDSVELLPKLLLVIYTVSGKKVPLGAFFNSLYRSRSTFSPLDHSYIRPIRPNNGIFYASLYLLSKIAVQVLLTAYLKQTPRLAQSESYEQQNL